MPEVPENMQENLQYLELEANGPRSANTMASPTHDYNQTQGHFPPRQASYQDGGPLPPANGEQWPARTASISTAFRGPPNVQPPTDFAQPSHDYNQFANAADARPCRAIMWPSSAVTIEAVSPGELIRMLVVDPPYIAP